MSPASTTSSAPSTFPDSSYAKPPPVVVEPKDVEMPKANPKIDVSKSFEDTPVEAKEDKDALKPVSTPRKKFPYEQD